MPHPYRKILGLNSPGDATHMAGDDFDILTKYHEDIDLSATHPSRVATNTEFRDNRLRILNPLRTNSISIRTLGFTEDLNITIPYLEADDDFMLLAANQEIYNKTISILDNEITNATGAVGDMLVFDGGKFIPFPRGLPSQHLAITEDGLSLIWVDPEDIVLPPAPPPPPGIPPPPPPSSMIPDDNSVTTAKIVDAAVTNSKLATNAVTSTKIIDGAIITAKIPALAITTDKLAGAITGAKMTNGTITNTQIASSTILNSNLFGSISNDKLLAITDTTKLPSSIRYDWTSVKPGAYTLTTASGGEGIWNGILQSTGTWTNHQTTSTNYRARFTTAASTNAQAGIRTTIPFVKPQHLIELTGKILIDTTFTNYRLFVGLTSATSSFPTPGTTINTWMTGVSGVGLLVDLPENANWRHIENDGTGAPAGGDISPTHSLAAGGNHTFKITRDDATSNFDISFNNNSNVISVDVPQANTAMGMLCYIETEEAVAKEFELAYLHTVCDAR